MSTRSRIGIQNADKSVTSIYCHWDGYPSNNGRILLEHYKTESKVRELMALGNISILSEEIGKKHSFEERSSARMPDGDIRHKWCLAYGRDRGETEQEATTCPSLQTAFSKQACEEYNYLFKNGKWHLWNGRRAIVLTPKMCEDHI